MGSLSVKHAFLFGLSVESLKMENLISDQNQVELDVILQNQFFLEGKTYLFLTPSCNFLNYTKSDSGP